MHNFVSFIECANSPSSACLLGLPSLSLYAFFAIAIVAGWRSRASDRGRHRLRVRRAFLSGIGLIAGGLIGVFAFAGFNPGTLMGVEEGTLLNALWILVIFAFGAGLMLAAAALGLWSGGFLVALFERHTGSGSSS